MKKLLNQFVVALPLLVASISSAWTGNEFEDLVEKLMPDLKSAYEEMALIRATKLKELQEHYEALSRFQYAPIIGAAPGSYGPILNINTIDTYFKHQSAVTALEPFIDGLEWEFIKKHIVPHTKRYSWAIPNDFAIQTIKKLNRPILEIGAGTGYWAKLLADQGVDILAFDNQSYHRNDEYRYTQSWFNVQIGTANTVPFYPERTLML